jgi:hypothetical protein
MKRQNLWTILFAFLFGQGIQLLTNAVAHYLYVSDPVMLCITVAVVTIALVILTAVFTLMDSEKGSNLERPQTRSTNANIIPPIFMDRRPPLDTDPEDIDDIDKNIRKENDHVQRKAPQGKHEAQTATA